MIERLSGEQNHRCAYCGFGMVRPFRWPRGVSWHAHRAWEARCATKDHLIPKCDGGSDNWANQVAACRWCNQYRHNQPAEFAYERIRRLIRRGTHPHQVYQETGRWVGYFTLQTIHRSQPQTSPIEAALS